MKQLPLITRLQILTALLTVVFAFGGIVWKISQAEARITSLERESNENKEMLKSMDKKIDAIYLKLIPNPK